MRQRNFIAALLIATMAACQNDHRQTACTLQVVYGVTALVVDATTGVTIRNADVKLTATNYQEQMKEPSPGVYVGAAERPGTYTVTATAPGYSLQSVAGIVVEAGECHVIPQAVTVPVYDLNGPVPVEIWWIDPRDGEVTTTVLLQHGLPDVARDYVAAERRYSKPLDEQAQPEKR